jgi:acetyl esterase/lipase
MSSSRLLHPRSVRRSAIAMVIGSLALLLVLVAGPTPRADANPPFDREVVTGINYNGSPGTMLDLYVPEFPGNAKLPLVIWSNGCAWLIRSCGTSGTLGIADEFNARGYAVAGVGIAGTLIPFGSGQTFPTQLHDVRAAIRWLRQNAATYSLDPKRFAIMGFSSGGWTSVIAGTTSDEASLLGEPDTNGLTNGVSSAVQAAVGFSSPTDFLQMDQWHDDHPEVPDFIEHDAANSPESLLVGCPIQTCPADTQAANPITYVEGSEVATLLLHGFMDPLVPHGQSELLYDALAAAGNEVTFISVDNAGHSPQEIRDGDEFTVYHTNRGGHETIEDKPAPTWEAIEQFIHVALSRAR